LKRLDEKRCYAEEKTKVSPRVSLPNRSGSKRTLANNNRKRIYTYIVSNPGINFNKLKEGLALSTGTTTFHLKVLLKRELITTRRKGYFVEYYPYNYKSKYIVRLTYKQKIVLNVIKKDSGISQADIIKQTRFAQSTVSWILNRLRENKMILSEYTEDKSGKMAIRYYEFNSKDLRSYNNCPFCGKLFRLNKSPEYCPFCNEKMK